MRTVGLWSSFGNTHICYLDTTNISTAWMTTANNMLPQQSAATWQLPTTNLPLGNCKLYATWPLPTNICHLATANNLPLGHYQQTYATWPLPPNICHLATANNLPLGHYHQTSATWPLPTNICHLATANKHMPLGHCQQSATTNKHLPLGHYQQHLPLGHTANKQSATLPLPAICHLATTNKHLPLGHSQQSAPWPLPTICHLATLPTNNLPRDHCQQTICQLYENVGHCYRNSDNFMWKPEVIVSSATNVICDYH